MFCLHRSSLSSFHHNTHTFQPFLILYKLSFFLFHFLIMNIALSLCYLVADTQVCDVTSESSLLWNGVQPRSSGDNAPIPIPHSVNCRDHCSQTIFGYFEILFIDELRFFSEEAKRTFNPIIYWTIIFIYRFLNNFSALLLGKINVFDILNIINEFQKFMISQSTVVLIESTF